MRQMLVTLLSALSEGRPGPRPKTQRGAKLGEALGGEQRSR